MGKTALLLIPLVLALTGCGMKGDLYLPASPAGTATAPAKPAPSPAPAGPVAPAPAPADEDETRKPARPPADATPTGN